MCLSSVWTYTEQRVSWQKRFSTSSPGATTWGCACPPRWRVRPSSGHTSGFASPWRMAASSSSPIHPRHCRGRTPGPLHDAALHPLRGRAAQDPDRQGREVSPRPRGHHPRHRGVSPPPMSPWATRCNWRATSDWTAFSASRCSATGRPCASARPSGVRCRPSTTPRWHRGYQFSRRRTFGRDRAAPVVLPALA